MLGHDQLIPEETLEQNQALIENLNRYYGTQNEDEASLARIRSRLLRNTGVSLPVTNDAKITQFPLPLQALPEKSILTHTGRRSVKNKSRHPYLNGLAAALLIALVGSFVVVLHLQPKATTAPEPPAVAHGWSLVASFHGTGNRTITGLNIELGNRSGSSLTCTSSIGGWASFTFNGDKEDATTAGCSGATLSEPLAPDDSKSSPIALAPIHSITVVTSNSSQPISWNLLLFKGIYYPPLKIDTANWHTLLGEIDGNGDWTSSVNILLPEVSALQYVCHGSGNFEINLQPDPQSHIAGVTSTGGLCDGQPQFDLSSTTGTEMTIQQIQITTSADNDWQVALLGCTNGKPDCGITNTTDVPASMP